MATLKNMMGQKLHLYLIQSGN